MPDADDDWRDEAAAGLVSMLPLLGPLMADPARRLARNLRAEHARNHSRALRAAQLTSGLSREDLAECINRNPRLVPIVTRVLFASAMTGQDEILDALGAALGSAAVAPTRVDEVELLLVGLQDLRRHHVMVLRVMSGPPVWKIQQQDGGGIGAAEITSETEGTTWNVEGIAARAETTIDTAYVAVTGWRTRDSSAPSALWAGWAT